MKDSDKSTIDSMKCPKCGALIAITETLRSQLAEQARAEANRELAGEHRVLIARGKEIQTREAKLQRAEQEIDDRVAKRMQVERSKISQEALKKARTDLSVELTDLQAEAAEKDRRLEEAQKKELQLRKEKRELETARQSLELDIARKIDAERQNIRKEAFTQAAEQHRLKNAEKDQKLSDALKMNEELSRKLQQGSQQIQGEVLELELENVLLECCASDEVFPVAKGMRGADVLQTVINKFGVQCGLIIWEAKHTKNWSDSWISKLKEDQQRAKADIAVLVTHVLPKQVDCFGKHDGVWVTTPKFVPGLVVALRVVLEEVAQAKRAVASKNETVEALFNYLTGSEFRNRVEAIMRVFIGMKYELDEEKRSTIRRWAKREKQLERVITNTSGMYGDLQGLMGTSLPSIPALDSGSSDGEGEEGITVAEQDDIPL